MTNSDIDIFSSVASTTGGDFFSFKEVGDSIQGTYINVRESVDSFGNTQFLYIIKDKNNKIWNVAFRKTNNVINEQMMAVKFGQIIGFKLSEKRPSTKTPGGFMKIIDVHQDLRIVDDEWLNMRGNISQNMSNTNNVQEEDVPDFGDNKRIEQTFDALTTQPVQPPSKEKVAIEAILSLAKNKGLVGEGMSIDDMSKAIEAHTGLSLTSENLTQIILKITSFTSPKV